MATTVVEASGTDRLVQAIAMAGARDGIGYRIIGTALLPVTTVLVALVTALPVRAAPHRQICVPE